MEDNKNIPNEEVINETEQWLLNGDCKKCRRQTYCSKKCTKGKRNLGSGVFVFDGSSKPKKLTDEEVQALEQGRGVVH